MSYSTNLAQIQCLRRHYIPIIYFTMMGSAASTILGIALAAVNTRLFKNDEGSPFLAFSFVEIIISFGKPSCFYYVMIK